MDYPKQFVTSLDFFSPGVYRIACEVTMQLLRDNKDSLMSVLDAFIYDPLVEWEDEKRKLVVKTFQVWNIAFFWWIILYRNESLLKRTLQKTRLTCTPLLNLPWTLLRRSWGGFIQRPKRDMKERSRRATWCRYWSRRRRILPTWCVQKPFTRFRLVLINLDRQECTLDGLLGTKREDGKDLWPNLYIHIYNSLC